MKLLVAAVVAAATLVANTEAYAASYSFSFTATGETFNGTLSTSTTGNSQLITSLNGLFNGAAATLAPSGAVNLNPTNDNLVYPNHTGTGDTSGSAGYLDGSGLGFVSGGNTYNLFYDTAASPSYGLQENSGTTEIMGTFNLTASAVSAAPEPGSWALLLGGVGILGAMMRVAHARRREDELKSLATA